MANVAPSREEARRCKLKSNVTLYIEAGAVLQGTANLEDYAEFKPAYASYTYSHRALIHAENAENVSILGKGAIDLRGRDFPPQPMPGNRKPGAMEWGQSPFGVRFVQCRNLTLRDITIRNCPADHRPSLVCDDVEDLELTGFHAANSGSEPIIRLHRVKGALLHGCRPRGEAFVAIGGERSAAVALLSNDLRGVRIPVVKVDNFAGEVAQAGNLEMKRP